jgi:hypothetical protein
VVKHRKKRLLAYTSSGRDACWTWPSDTLTLKRPQTEATGVGKNYYYSRTDLGRIRARRNAACMGNETSLVARQGVFFIEESLEIWLMIGNMVTPERCGTDGGKVERSE